MLRSKEKWSIETSHKKCSHYSCREAWTFIASAVLLVQIPGVMLYKVEPERPNTLFWSRSERAWSAAASALATAAMIFSPLQFNLHLKCDLLLQICWQLSSHQIKILLHHGNSLFVLVRCTQLCKNACEKLDQHEPKILPKVKACCSSTWKPFFWYNQKKWWLTM